MKKINNEKQAGITRYLRELSIVIIGVFVTLVATNIILVQSKYNEVDRMIELVKTEMEENLNVVSNAQKKYVSEKMGYDLILQNINKLETISLDTLNFYKKIIGDKHSLSFSKDSYEVFKSSMYMQYVEDKIFLRELSAAYGNMELVNSKLENYSYLKGNGLDDMISNISQQELEKWNNGNVANFYIIPLQNTVFRAFTIGGRNVVVDEDFTKCKDVITKLIQRIENKEY